MCDALLLQLKWSGRFKGEDHGSWEWNLDG
jgi:hypothetical protein